MKSRHAAALALVGWYLMFPPNYQYEEENAPLSEWNQARSFDTSAACEQERMQMFDTMTKHKAKNMSIKDQDRNARLYWSARCIATDDPRLKGN